MTTLEELEKRVVALEAAIALTDLCRAVSTINMHLEDVRIRITRVEARLDTLDSNFRAFQRNLPAMIAETMREVQSERNIKLVEIERDIKLVEMMRTMMDERDRRR